MGIEWFYLNDINWFRAIDGRIVTPVKGVVTHIGVPDPEIQSLPTVVAEQSIVDVMPFGKCYEKRALEALWDEINGHGIKADSEGSEEGLKDCTDEDSEGLKDCTDEPETEENEASEKGQFVNLSKISEAPSGETEGEPKIG